MTLIAALLFQDHPFLIGDLLTSTPGGSEVVLPTIGRLVPQPRSTDAAPSSMRQKIALVGKQCALGWSGSLVEAQSLVRELRRLDDLGLLNHATLLEAATEADSPNLNAFIWWFEPESRQLLNVEVGHFQSSDVPGVQLVRASGTGANHLLWDGTENAPSLLSRLVAAAVQSGNLHADWSGRDLAFSIYGGLLAHEVNTHEAPIDYLYGGGYEVAYLDRGAFKMLEAPSLFLAYQIATDGGTRIVDQQLSLPALAMVSIYEQGDLCVTSHDFDAERPDWRSTWVGDVGRSLPRARYPEGGIARRFVSSRYLLLIIEVLIDQTRYEVKQVVLDREQGGHAVFPLRHEVGANGLDVISLEGPIEMLRSIVAPSADQLTAWLEQVRSSTSS